MAQHLTDCLFGELGARMPRFYRIVADPDATSRCHMSAPITHQGQDVDPRLFTVGKKYEGEKDLEISLRYKGEFVDFNFADFDMVVSKKSLNELMQRIVGSDIQRIPVMVNRDMNGYEILNVLATISCIDEEKSEYIKWTSKDGREDKIGQFRSITKLVIDPNKISGRLIFRIKEWRIALIVEERIKRLFEGQGISGVVFQPVS